MGNSDPSFTNTFPAAFEADWRKRVDAVLKGADFDKKLVSRTFDNLNIGPLYGRKSASHLIAGASAGRPWRVMVRVDHPAIEDAAKLAIADLEGGADALALVFAGGRSARGYGLTCKTVADLDGALEGVRLDLIDIRLDLAPGDTTAVQMMAALVKSRKLDPSQLRVDFSMDSVAAVLTGAGNNWGEARDKACAVVQSLTKEGFKGPFLSIDMRPYHEAGASEGQELAAALAQGVLYLRALETQGLTLAAARDCLSFVMPFDGDQFLGVAKVRALRMLWQKIDVACGLIPKPILIHAETSWRMMTKRDSYVNILRSTVAAFAAGIGGADSVTVLPFTQALGLPDEQARRLARNTSIVLQEEANLWRVIDPTAGAGGFEAITEELSAKAWELFQDIEREGGLVESLAKGLLQARIGETHTARMRAISTRKEPITGTSEFANLTEITPTVLDIEPARTALHRDANQALVSHRVSEPFERLRDHADAVSTATGKRPHVRLFTVGPLADHALRLAFTQNVFVAGGFEVEVTPYKHDSFLLQQKELAIVCIVGSDSAYTEHMTAIAHDLAASSGTIWLAGNPSKLDTTLQADGVARFVFAGCDVVAELSLAHGVLAEINKSNRIVP